MNAVFIEGSANSICAASITVSELSLSLEDLKDLYLSVSCANLVKKHEEDFSTCMQEVDQTEYERSGRSIDHISPLEAYRWQWPSYFHDR